MTLARPEGLPPIPLVDIGVNLTGDAFAADLDAVLERARGQGVVRQLVTGTDVAHARTAIELARRHPGELYATAGVHPHAAQDVEDDWLAVLAELLGDVHVRALGETGLDFNRNYSPPDAQERAFRAQLDLARQHDKPLFLHERDTDGRFFELLRAGGETAEERVQGVLHCFTGSADDLDRALEAGLHLGITGWICDERRGGELQRLVSRIPPERLLIETDAPYLLPRTLRPRPKTRRNEPGWLPWVLVQVAACRDEDPVALARRTTANACRLFDLPLPTEPPAAAVRG